jgi:hypothetical protein
MRLRRLAAAEMVGTPAGAWPGRGFGVLPGGGGGWGAGGGGGGGWVWGPPPTSIARAPLSSSYRRRSQALMRHDALPGGVGAAQGRGGT